MQKLAIHILSGIFCLCSLSESLAQKNTPFQLAQPLVHSTYIFFTDSTIIEMELDMEGVHIHYTLDANTPDATDSKYSEPIRIKESTQLKAIAMHEDCIDSEVTMLRLFKAQKLNLLEASVSPLPDKRYAGEGISSLFDLEKGSTDFKDDKWLAVAKKDMEINFMYADSLELSSVVVSTFSDPRSWIFPPIGMEVWVADSDSTFVKIANTEVAILSEMEKPNLQFQTCTFDPVKTNHLKVIVKNTETIPEWHLRAGKGSWLFVDEVVLESGRKSSD